jgi:hypothetical protein
MTELVSKDAGKLLEAEACRQGNADRQNQSAAEEAEQGPLAMRAGVQVAIHLDTGQQVA